MLATLKQALKARRNSANPIVRHGIGAAHAVYVALDAAAAACREFLTNGEYRSIVLLRWFRSQRVHQTTVLTWMDRYPEVFASAREYFRDRKDLRILSFGCSTGEEVLTLRHYFPGAFITGAEINPRSLAICRAHRVDERIAFVRPDREQLLRNGLFDAIFCMAVLQRTPHTVASQGIASLKRIYPFRKFDRQLSELDDMLVPGGLLVVYHSHYLFGSAKVAPKYEQLTGFAQPASRGPKFDRNSELLPDPPVEGSMFIKSRE